MKQTNNAIKFLMAQYRAIFKNAYFKGLTSAVLLTAGLAVAGGAQAAAPASIGNGLLDVTDMQEDSAYAESWEETVTQNQNIDLKDWGAGNRALDKLSVQGASLNIEGDTVSQLSFNTLNIQDGGSLTLSNSGRTDETGIAGFIYNSGLQKFTYGLLNVDNKSSVALNSASMSFQTVNLTSGSSVTLGGYLYGTEKSQQTETDNTHILQIKRS